MRCWGTAAAPDPPLGLVPASHSPAPAGHRRCPGPSTWLPLGKGGCAGPRASLPREFNGTEPGASAPAPGPAHALSGPNAGALGAAGCGPTPAPIETGPAPPPRGDPLTAPTMGWRIKIIKQQVRFPGQRRPPQPPPCSRAVGPDGANGAGSTALLCQTSAGTSTPKAPQKHLWVLVLWGRRGRGAGAEQPGAVLCASAPPARPPRSVTPVKRSSSCSEDNKTLFFFLPLFYCTEILAAQREQQTSSRTDARSRDTALSPWDASPAPMGATAPGGMDPAHA